jgi:ribonuclease HI
MSPVLPRVTLYTDGGCRPNPGPGGWAVAILRPEQPPEELSGAEPDTTNNRMELRAAIEGLRALEEPSRITLYTDSEYLRKGITEWLPRWQQSGWRTAKKGEVKNVDLWTDLADELERHEVTWKWVRGHSGDRWNERVDELAAATIPSMPLPVEDAEAVHLFLAVAYSRKQDAGAWSALLRFGDRHRVVKGRVVGTSANRMHLTAAAAGLAELKRQVRVHAYTTSDYLRDGATTWVQAWKSRGWKTREGRSVAHVDLWRTIDRLAGRHELKWHVVDRKNRPEEMQQAKAEAKEALSGVEEGRG